MHWDMTIMSIASGVSNIQIVVSKCFQFGHVQNSAIWERVNNTFFSMPSGNFNGQGIVYIQPYIDERGIKLL